MSFIFGGDTGLSYDQIQSRRKVAEAMMNQGGTPRNIGEGINSFAKSITGALVQRRLDKADKANEAKSDELWGSMWGMGAPNVSTSGTPSQFDAMAAYGGPTNAAAAEMDQTTALRNGIIETAQAIGADPLDLATTISYETAGTFDPTKAGPTTQWGQHRGLIQFGEPQAEQYGVNWDDPIGSQLGADGAVANYFRGSGFQPGMSGLDLYSTVNAGAPGRYSASDANNGGAPGDVRNKWETQMGDHRVKAAALLGGEYAPQGGQATMSARGGPPQGGGGPGLQQIAQALSDPYIRRDPGKVAVLQALLQREMAPGMNPLQQVQLEQARLDLEQDRNPTPEAGFRPATPEEAGAYGAASGQFGPDGRFYPVAGADEINITNNMPGQDKFDEEFAKLDAQGLSTISESGLAAQRNLGRIDQLEGLLQTSPSGMAASVKSLAGNFGINTEGLDDIQAAEALINSLVPEQRQPGSGPMSDADLALFKKSLPRLINQPGGNQKIIETMRAIGNYDAEGAQIVQQLRAGKIDRGQAFDMLYSRENPVAGFGEAPSPDGPTPVSGDSAPPQATVGNDREGLSQEVLDALSIVEGAGSGPQVSPNPVEQYRQGLNRNERRRFDRLSPEEQAMEASQ